MVLSNLHIHVGLVAAVLAFLSHLLQMKFADRKTMKKKQEEMKKKQERMRELMNSKDEKAKKELQLLEEEMMESMSGMMKSSMKMMVISMALIVPVFWFLHITYEGIAFELPFPVPWFGGNFFIMLYTTTNWIGWYALCSLLFSLGINIAMLLHDKIRGGGKGA